MINIYILQFNLIIITLINLIINLTDYSHNDSPNHAPWHQNLISQEYLQMII